MQHTKLKRLVRALKVPQYAAVGILESLWHLTAREAPEGNIGKLSNEDIAAWIDWECDSDDLIAALVTAGWIDHDTDNRLVIHDWHEHADDATKLAMKRKAATRSECVGQVPTENNKTPLPEPLPEPVPEKKQATTSTIAPLGAVATVHPDLEIYNAYPRKEGKGAAMTEINRAVARLAKGEAPHAAMTKLEAQRYLMRRVLEYARSPVGSQSDKTKIPHPATWFHQKRYDDDQANWHRTEMTSGRQHSKTGGNLDAGAQAVAYFEQAERNSEPIAEVQHEEGIGGDSGDLRHLRTGSIDLRAG